mgnify:CR=1 FL=1
MAQPNVSELVVGAYPMSIVAYFPALMYRYGLTVNMVCLNMKTASPQVAIANDLYQSCGLGLLRVGYVVHSAEVLVA